jgi:acetyl-CoA C-acetyltransferase
MEEVYIVSAVRTPIGSFNGLFSSVPATTLGSAAIEGALKKIGLNSTEVQEVYMGNVLQAGLGQAPARQAALNAGIGNNVPCTTVNKVCASGLKSVMLAAQSIMLGQNDVVVAGGMENMSRVPHYMMGSRAGYKYGDVKMIDGIGNDGLKDAYDHQLMGVAADNTAAEYDISREEQDAFAIESYNRAAKAWKNDAFKDEVVSVEVPQRRGEPLVISEDEEYKNVRFDKIPNLRAAFSKEGTVTAANASTMNDGAAALVLMSKSKAESLGLKPLAKIIGFADAAKEPKWFTVAPSEAIPKALDRASCAIGDVDYFEINEAFSVVSLANNKILGLDPTKVNVNGGAVSLGHPLGVSGARILVTLVHVLQQNNAKLGVAGICNGGGGAGAMVISRNF